jgi:hypothetical protein
VQGTVVPMRPRASSKDAPDGLPAGATRTVSCGLKDRCSLRLSLPIHGRRGLWTLSYRRWPESYHRTRRRGNEKPARTPAANATSRLWVEAPVSRDWQAIPAHCGPVRDGRWFSVSGGSVVNEKHTAAPERKKPGPSLRGNRACGACLRILGRSEGTPLASRRSVLTAASQPTTVTGDGCRIGGWSAP